MKNIFIIALGLISLGVFAQETMHPSPAQSKTIVITGATLHVGNGTVRTGTVVIEKGKLIIEATAPAITAAMEHIDATGKHVYPGIIAPHTN